MTLKEIKGLLEKAQLGPWEAEDTGDIVVASTRQVIADFVPRSGNRLLLAAAPELAALLVRAVEELKRIVGQEETRCPCCNETEKCLPDCTYVVDCRHDAAEMGFRRLLFAPSRTLLRELGVEA